MGAQVMQQMKPPMVLEGIYEPLDRDIIGTGADGTISLVRRVTDDRTLAAKCFRPRPTAVPEDEYYSSIRSEHWLSSRLQHPNIIQVFDLIEGTRSPCEIMEYFPMNLRQVLHTGTLSLGQIDCIFYDMLLAVAYMHSMGYAHRDLKPGNIMIDKHGWAKLIDFGTASAIHDPLNGKAIRIHGVWGSSEYSAPECHGESTFEGMPADIWSLAMVYIFAVTTEEPWTSATNRSSVFSRWVKWRTILKAHGSHVDAVAANSLGTELNFVSHLPKDSVELILRMTEEDPNLRPTWQGIFTTPWIRNLSRSCTVHD
ncbi:hypothetical protein PV08_05689 [Exophiala spinifera]|uniref:Protein kinase domain-containing protein n=1 Tax=Exophiala spinifera TaxID=91928 RepID=A0A0D2BAM8_9EURO|nr:uncharacterized protein PV08_05689 [Exophiala spinifera]KIW15640.1 hypothetical protein PV08_05689 [Exophiala spinifera]